MDEARRTAYLDALGIPSWISRAPAQAETGRDAPPADVRLRVCPGIGSVLMICGDRDLTASLLADDIRRALGDDPVWAWPGESDGEILQPQGHGHLMKGGPVVDVRGRLVEDHYREF